MRAPIVIVVVFLCALAAAATINPTQHLQSPRMNGHFSGCTALFAYKINWQSVMFVGYGDDRDLTLQNRLVPTGHQVFVKLSYAIQR